MISPIFGKDDGPTSVLVRKRRPDRFAPGRRTPASRRILDDEDEEEKS